MIEVVALRRVGRDRLRFARAFAVARPLLVARQSVAAAVGANLRDRYGKVGIRLVDADPGRELEKTADLGFLIEWRAVIN
jgi:hypothetical protein